MEPRSKMLDFFPRPLTSRLAPDFLVGGGEMGERIRSHDWMRTVLGAARDWPQGLKTAVRIMLASRQPMSIWWGAELTVLYNDACRALIGGNHPAALGQAAPCAWREIWDDMGPRVEGAIRSNEQGAARPVPLLVERHGRVEEAHYTITFTAMPGEASSTGGVLCSFTDVTQSVVCDRQMNLLESVAMHAAGATTLEDACVRAAAGLGEYATDIPFAAIYLVDAEESEARLAASAGIARGHAALPEKVAIDDDCPWPFAEALAPGTRPFQPVMLGESIFGPFPSGPWSRPPREAAVVRLGSTGIEGKHAVLIAALNPFRVLSDDHRRFIELVSAQVAAGIANAQARSEERRRLEAETSHEVARDIASELRELDQRKDEFLATLAHELRNPLAPLRNGLEVMRLASGNPDTVEKARSMMQRQLSQMVRLVDDLLDVSRVGRGKIELRRGAIELAAVLRNALETSRPLMNERRHQLISRIPVERIVLDGDMTRLSQVFSNLLDNAAKYTECGGRIELSVQRLDAGVAVSVKDNGIGIPANMLSRVFDIFTQVDRWLEKSRGGLGIGLSIAKRLVEMHGGTIEVASEGHRMGSEFIVRLPARLESARDAQPDETGRALAKAGGRRRILVADDNPDSAATLAIMLEVLGNEVRVAHDGQQAVEIAATFRPDAILLDIGMPRLNGYDACEKIRRHPWGAHAFIVALTGWGQDEDRDRSRAAGFDRHLVKPVEPATIEKLIQGLPSPKR